MVQVSTQVVPFNGSQPFSLPDTANSVGNAVTVYAAAGAVGELDNFFITVINTSPSPLTINFIFAGSTDLISLAVPADSFAQLQQFPYRLEAGTNVQAFATPAFSTGDLLILARVDRLTNPAQPGSQQASNVIVANTPTQYTPTNSSVEGHLIGVNAALRNQFAVTPRIANFAVGDADENSTQSVVTATAGANVTATLNALSADGEIVFRNADGNFPVILAAGPGTTLVTPGSAVNLATQLATARCDFQQATNTWTCTGDLT